VPGFWSGFNFFPARVFGPGFVFGVVWVFGPGFVFEVVWVFGPAFCAGFIFGVVWVFGPGFVFEVIWGFGARFLVRVYFFLSCGCLRRVLLLRSFAFLGRFLGGVDLGCWVGFWGQNLIGGQNISTY
jgi:hypothetical protein